MTSEDNLEFLRQENRRYIIGTNKALLKKFEQELLKQDWTTIRDGIEVKLCKMPKEENSDSTDEVTVTFILCRSQDRKEKDKAIVQRAADKIAERLATMKTSPTSPTTSNRTMKTLVFGFFVSTTFCSREFE